MRTSGISAFRPSTADSPANTAKATAESAWSSPLADRPRANHSTANGANLSAANATKSASFSSSKAAKCPSSTSGSDRRHGVFDPS